MNKKIFSAILALSMLGQSAFATSLNEFVKEKLSNYTTITGGVSDGIFNYSIFVEKLNEANGTDNPTEIHADVTTGVAKEGNTTYSSRATSISNKFDYKVTLDMEGVNSSYSELYNTAKASLLVFSSGDPDVTDLDNSTLTGNFTVVTDYDPNLSFDEANFVFSQEGVSDSIFAWDNNPVVDEAAHTATFSFTAETTVAEINDSYSASTGRYTALNDLVMTVTGVTANLRGTNLPVTVRITDAYIELTEAGAEKYGRVDFTSDESTATVFVQSINGGVSIPSDEEPPKAITVVDGVHTPEEVVDTDGIYTVDVSAFEIPEKEGFVFDGWYTDPTFLNPVDGTVEIEKTTYFYAKFISTKAPANLISDDHILYIVGYPDGEVKPNGNITREEVVAAFYRLLDPEYRATIETTEHNFPDVEAGRWSNTSVATMANGGYIVGDENGYFNPGNPITRAEFVTIAVKFMNETEAPKANYFSDITGHWAEDSIKKAAHSYYWILGYEDGTFRPNAYITRAEAMTIINKMLVRYGDVACSYAKQWPDVSPSDWYYSNIIEATTEHAYTRNVDGWSETWIAK